MLCCSLKDGCNDAILKESLKSLRALELANITLQEKSFKNLLGIIHIDESLSEGQILSCKYQTKELKVKHILNS